jgi:tetratricopeptide (TPR) repeat protein
MATYKKRGGKPSTKAELEASIEDGSTTAEVFNTLDESASRTEEWVIKNQKYIFIIVGLAAVLVLGYLGFSKYIQEPKESQATNDLFQSQQYFDQAVNGASKDSLFTLSLNGFDGKYGFIDIAEVYAGTDAGNLANYYAGMAFLNMKDYPNAVTYLNAFSSDDDVLGPIAKGGIGDAFVQLEQLEDAYNYYVQAAELKSNNYTTPMYLYKAGVIGLKLGKNKQALGFFNQIKSEFSESNESKNIEVFIGKAEAAIN